MQSKARPLPGAATAPTWATWPGTAPALPSRVLFCKETHHSAEWCWLNENGDNYHPEK